MSPKELNRVDVIRDISERKLRQKDAAELLKLSRRHIQRFVNQYREQGPAGLVSLRHGKPSNRRYTPEFMVRNFKIPYHKAIFRCPTLCGTDTDSKHVTPFMLIFLTLYNMQKTLYLSVNRVALYQRKRGIKLIRTRRRVKV
ncbi:helix-turn-helix domain-containing protein [Photobacterium leiognathi]